MSNRNIAKAIAKTLIYADIFNYPLTKEEIWKWLIQCRMKKVEFKSAIQNSKAMKNQKGYYLLKGRENIITLRSERKKYAHEKLKIARQIAHFLKFIPTIKLVGITGALAMDNTTRDDDIDLFIITSYSLLWTTRFLATIVIELTGKRRHPQDILTSNKICLNMFVDEFHLAIPIIERDIFSAHEVLQMKPILVRDNTYYKFLSANLWAKKYLPNAYQKITIIPKPKDTSEVAESVSWRIGWWRNQKGFFQTLENLLKRFQLWHMRNRRTSEKISIGFIRFHPQDARRWILKEYNRRLSVNFMQSHKSSK